MPLILSTHALHPKASAMLAAAGELRIASAFDAATLAREATDADIVVVRAPLPEALFSTARKLKAAIRHGAGLDMIPMDAATAAGVLVANVPGVNARSVAEHVFFAILALLRRFRSMDRDLREKGWLAGRAHADGNQLEMALLNLGVNARDAMPDGGTLTLSARGQALESGRDAALPAGDYVVIAVADTGRGMDEATRRRAVEPFFTTKGLGKGTGLGLSMVHGLASQLGGELRIDSLPGRGTTMELWLPATAA